MNHRDQDARTAPMDLGDCPHHAIGAAALNGQVAHLRGEQAVLLPSSELCVTLGDDGLGEAAYRGG